MLAGVAKCGAMSRPANRSRTVLLPSGCPRRLFSTGLIAWTAIGSSRGPPTALGCPVMNAVSWASSGKMGGEVIHNQPGTEYTATGRNLVFRKSDSKVAGKGPACARPGNHRLPPY